MKKNYWQVVVEKIGDLNIGAKDKVILVKRLDEAILLKAEVIGVSEIIYLESEVKDEESEVKLKKVSEDEWKKLR